MFIAKPLVAAAALTALALPLAACSGGSPAPQSSSSASATGSPSANGIAPMGATASGSATGSPSASASASAVDRPTLTVAQLKAILPAAKTLGAGWALDPTNPSADKDTAKVSPAKCDRPTRIKPGTTNDELSPAAKASVDFAGTDGAVLGVRTSSYATSFSDAEYRSDLAMIPQCAKVSIADAGTTVQLTMKKLPFPALTPQTYFLRSTFAVQGTQLVADTLEIPVGRTFVELSWMGPTSAATGSQALLERVGRSILTALDAAPAGSSTSSPKA